VILHSENGIVGLRGLGEGEVTDLHVIDAGKQPVGLVRGAAIVDHEDSFTLIRGGRLDVGVLGAFEVSERGDLASWILSGEELGSVGGAMDIAVGARRIVVMMRHVDRRGWSKLVRKCHNPLTAAGCVRRVYTDLAVIDVESTGCRVKRLAPGMTLQELQRITAVHLASEA
jgi:3-oxoacid CoA-transferase B subunit